MSDESGDCKYCKARLLWVSTPQGNRMALDYEADRRYVVDAGHNPIRARVRNTYTCHFDTCKKRPT